MRRPPSPFRKLHWTRDDQGDELIELLLVFAVVTILAIRGFLALTGYPQLGGHGLHIAHMLWGGFAMLAALCMLILYWDPGARRLAAAVGGVGFGFFIDELGKFLTLDNDYFFRPTVAVLYVMFLVLFLVVRVLRDAFPPSPAVRERNLELRTLLEPPGRARGPGIPVYFRVRDAFLAGYRRLARHLWFRNLLVGAFLLLAVVSLVEAAQLVAHGKPADWNLPLVQGIAAVAQALCVWVGAAILPRSRIAAYEWFRRSVAISLLFVQVGTFYAKQFWALPLLLLHLLVYLALGILIDGERLLAERRIVSR